MKELKVSGSSCPNKVAGSIMYALEADETPVLISIGPISLNSAVKGLIIAMSLAKSKGWCLTAKPCFVTLDTEKGTATAIRYEITKD